MTKLNPLLVGFCGILLITLWHILTLYTNGVNLFFDEAQYWNWAKNLDFGYYSKPPFIAWAIAATTGVCSDTEPCIRLASPLAHMMTAIALLFAILKLRPSPFCLLDEIEAALDESNVYRLSRYLNTLHEKIQFIMVTHRKGTMENAGALYGVTMEEKGVSKVVSIKL